MTSHAKQPADLSSEALAARLDPLIDASIREARIVGSVTLVSVDGNIAYQRVAGHIDREAGKAMERDAVFRLASVSKPMVAATALALVEDGLMTLDEPITRFLPEFRPKLADGSEPIITLRHLLTHTAGFRYKYDPAAGICEGLAGPALTMEENLARIAAVPLLFAPGSAFEYGVSIDVIGGILEAVTGRTLPEVVAEKITGPLGMASTEFNPSQPERLAAAYADGTPPTLMTDPQVVKDGEGWITFSPGRCFDRAVFASGGAGMIGTAPDFLKFLEAVRTGGGPVLDASSVSLLANNAIGELSTGVDGRGFSLGWSLHHTPSASGAPYSPGSWQWGGAYGHSWFVDPALKLSVVAFTNTAMEGVGGRYPDQVRDAVYG